MSNEMVRSSEPGSTGEKLGSVVLRRTNLPIILCDLLGFTKTGCRCIAHVQFNDAGDTERWSALFRVGELFDAEIVYDPYIPFLYQPVQILASAALTSKDFKLGFEFLNLDADIALLLTEALARIDATKQQMSNLPPSDSQLNSAPASTDTITDDAPMLGEILWRTSALEREQIDGAVLSARQSGLKLGEYLVSTGMVTPLQILEARSAQTGLAYADFDINTIPEDLLKTIPMEQLKSFKCVPVAMDDETIRIACANPISKPELNALEKLCGKRVTLILCPDDLPAKFLDALDNGMLLKRRVDQRFKVSMQASIRCCAGEGALSFDGEVPVQVIDISKGGMQVIVPATLRLDLGAIPPERLKLMVTVHAIPKEIVALCEARHIRYVSNDSGGSDCVYGLRIDKIIDKEAHGQ